MDVARGTIAPAFQPSAPQPSDASPDTLSDVLEVVRLTGALFFLVDARTPWVVEAPSAPQLVPVILRHAQHIVSYHVVRQGACWCDVGYEFEAAFCRAFKKVTGMTPASWRQRQTHPQRGNT